jgi:hypothetical protein
MPRMRTIAKLLLVAFSCMVLFIVGILATFEVNVLIYGLEEFNHNAGAGFAVLLEGSFVGILFAIIGIPLIVYFSDYIPWLRDSS